MRSEEDSSLCSLCGEMFERPESVGSGEEGVDNGENAAEGGDLVMGVVEGGGIDAPEEVEVLITHCPACGETDMDISRSSTESMR